MHCTSLTNVTLPGNLISIGDRAFCSSGLTGILIPASVTSIGKEAFASSRILPSIVVSATNPAYCTVDGVLFSKDQTMLIACPSGKTGNYVIPAIVTRVEEGAFLNCKRLTNVTIPNGVTSIGNHTFFGCASLTNVSIPDSVIRIENYAFLNCPNLAEKSIPKRFTNFAEILQMKDKDFSIENNGW